MLERKSSQEASPLINQVEKLETNFGRPDDYCVTYTNGSVNIGAAEMQGYRHSQEDYLAVAVDEIKIFTQLSWENQQIALQHTFEEMQQSYGQYESVGSTGCVATTWIDEKQNLHVTTANLGDSSAYLVILDNENNVIKSERLNSLHKPDAPEEKKRIEAAGGYVGNFGVARLNDDLAVSRVFGDMAHENKGISHVPDVVTFPEYKLSSGQKAFVVVACDGLDIVGEKKIGKMLSENISKSPAEMANILVTAGLSSGDNVSAAVIPVNTTPVSAAIFDGHGGSEVANNIGRHFYAALEHNLRFLLSHADLQKKEKLELMQRESKERQEKREANFKQLKNKLDATAKELIATLSDFQIFTEHDSGEARLFFTHRGGTECLELENKIIHLSKINNLKYQTCDFPRDGIVFSCSEGDLLPESWEKFIAEAKKLLAPEKTITPTVSGFGMFASTVKNKVGSVNLLESITKYIMSKCY